MLKTLDNALTILEYFTKEKTSWGVRELSKELDMSHTVVYRILKTYEQHGFLKQDPTNEKYELGIRFLEYGFISKYSKPISQQIDFLMYELCELVGESIFLTWLDRYEGLTLNYCETNNSIKFTVERGSRTPLYAGASNKIILAYLSEREKDYVIRNGLEAITESTITNRQELLKDLNQIKLQRFAHTVGEFNPDVTGLAVPLFEGGGKIVASLTIAGPTYRMTNEKVKDYLPHLHDASSKIQPFIKQYRF